MEVTHLREVRDLPLRLACVGFKNYCLVEPFFYINVYDLYLVIRLGGFLLYPIHQCLACYWTKSIDAPSTVALLRNNTRAETNRQLIAFHKIAGRWYSFLKTKREQHLVRRRHFSKHCTWCARAFDLRQAALVKHIAVTRVRQITAEMTRS